MKTMLLFYRETKIVLLMALKEHLTLNYKSHTFIIVEWSNTEKWDDFLRLWGFSEVTGYF